MRLFIAALVSCVLAVASIAAEPAKIEVGAAWARASGGRTQSAAAYVTIANRSPSDDRLVAVASPVAKSAMIHKEEMGEGNLMRMKMVDGIDIAAGQTVTFVPGGYHVMLTELERPLAAGQHFPLTLRFAKAGETTVDVAVQSIGAMGPPASHDPKSMPAMPHGHGGQH